MTENNETIEARIAARFDGKLVQVESTCGELTYECAPADLLDVATALRDEPEFAYEQLIDVCGVDYLTYGSGEWDTESATSSGFSRSVEREPIILDEADSFADGRFAAVYHLLSVARNSRLRLRVFTGTAKHPQA